MEYKRYETRLVYLNIGIVVYAGFLKINIYQLERKTMKFLTPAQNTNALEEKRIYTAVSLFFSGVANRHPRSNEYSVTSIPQDLEIKPPLVNITRSNPELKTRLISLIAEISGLTVTNPQYFVSDTGYTLSMHLTPAQYAQGCVAAAAYQAQQQQTTTTTSSSPSPT